MISVLIPSRNSEKTIEKSIRSVLDQNGNHDIEVLCIINGTTDKTQEVVESIRDERIKIFHSSPGIVPALNEGIRRSRGDYIARQDSDDVWMQNKILKQMDFLDKNPQIDVLGTQLNVVDGEDNFIRTTSYPTDHQSIATRILWGENSLGHPSVVFRKRILDKCSGYFDLFPLAEDLDLWTRCIPWFKFANLNEPLVQYKHVPNPSYNPTVPKALSAWYRSIYGVNQ